MKSRQEYYMKKIWKNRKILIFIVVGIIFIWIAMLAINEGVNHYLTVNSTDSRKEKIYQYHVAMINGDISADMWNSIYKGAKKEGKKNDIYIENFGEKISRDYTTEELVDMAIASKVDGIIVQAYPTDKMNALIEKAHEQGILVMTIMNDAPNSKRISYVSANDYTLGDMYGDQVKKEVEKRIRDGEKQVRVTVLTNSEIDNMASNLIYLGIREKTSILGESIKLSTITIDGTRAFTSEETIRNLVLDRDYPQVIVCLDSVDTAGACQSVIDYNQVGKISIIGYYLSEETLEGIKKGIIRSSVVIDAEAMGQTAAGAMAEYFTDEYVSEYLTVAPQLITNGNVDEYIQKDE